MARSIEAHPDAGLFYSDFNLVDDDLRFLCRARCENLSGNAYKRLLHRTPIATSTAVVKRECFSVCGLFSAAAACEDWAMWLRVSRKFPLKYVSLALCEYTRHTRIPSLGSVENLAKAQGPVVENVLGDDPHLTTGERESVRAWAFYREGRYRMMSGQGRAALSCFRQSTRHDGLHWRSWLFFIFIRINAVVSRWMVSAARSISQSRSEQN